MTERSVGNFPVQPAADKASSADVTITPLEEVVPVGTRHISAAANAAFFAAWRQEGSLEAQRVPSDSQVSAGSAGEVARIDDDTPKAVGGAAIKASNASVDDGSANPIFPGLERGMYIP